MSKIKNIVIYIKIYILKDSKYFKQITNPSFTALT